MMCMIRAVTGSQPIDNYNYNATLLAGPNTDLCVPIKIITTYAAYQLECENNLVIF